MKQVNEMHNNLLTVRKRLGFSQQELASAAGVTRQTISGIESLLYAPSTTIALRLARSLGCRVEDLFWLEDAQPSIAATLAGTAPGQSEMRVSLAQIDDRWIAHPLLGKDAFRYEAVPCDGIARWDAPTASLQVAPLDEIENLCKTVVLAGCTPALSLWARAAERWYPGLRVQWIFANSAQSLDYLQRGEVHAAGLHMYDKTTGECNVPFVKRNLPHEHIILMNLGIWEEGLLVAAGNPKRITDCADLARADVRIVNREAGAGCRALLEDRLLDAGIAPASVRGYDDIAPGHFPVAQAVAQGVADAGISISCVAAAYGLDFIALRQVRYDFAIPHRHLELDPMKQLLTSLDHHWVRSQLAVLGGYDTTHTGEVMAELFPDAAIGEE